MVITSAQTNMVPNTKSSASAQTTVPTKTMMGSSVQTDLAALAGMEAFAEILRRRYPTLDFVIAQTTFEATPKVTASAQVDFHV